MKRTRHHTSIKKIKKLLNVSENKKNSDIKHHKTLSMIKHETSRNYHALKNKHKTSDIKPHQ